MMLIRYITLLRWPVDLESSWYIKRHMIKVYKSTNFERNQAIPGWIIDNFANFCTRYVTLWPRPLIYWPWKLEFVQNSGCRVYKLMYNIWMKSNNRRHWQFSTFRDAILGVWHFCPTVLTDAWTQLHQTCQSDRAIIPTYTRSLFQISDILLHFQTRATQIWVMLKTTPNFTLLTPCNN